MLSGKKAKFISLFLSMIMILAFFSGCSSKDSGEETSSGDDATKETATETVKDYDVVVIGGGAAGLSAAIEASEAGSKVVVLEKMPFVGGSTLISGGIIYATGSELQEKAGVEDSVENLVNYWMERSEGHADEVLLRTVAEKSGDTINWLVNDVGVELPNLSPAGISPVLRAHSTTDGGNGIIAPLKAYAESKNVEILLETTAKELIQSDDGQITGVKAVDKDDNEITFNAKSVVLATGGFDRNEDLMKKYNPDLMGKDNTNYVGMGNTGDGLLMAGEVGAEIVGNGGVIGIRGVEGEPNFESEVSMIMWSPYLLVNKEGKRFVNEATDYPIIHTALSQQTDKSAYLIFDGTTYNELLDKAVERGEAFVSDSLEDLASQAGLDKDVFAATVTEYNSMVESGQDTLFGKDMSKQTKIENAKFYAVKVVSATIGTMTGVKIDADTHVLDKEGQPIPNLYAAGEVANGDFFYREYPASGTSIQMSLTFGRIAGTNAAEK
ncbi:FAD-dependent oxidoreductase [Bacillus tuaregi]|uniref:FAD-dependent oxidoreductase n=1 Tax=Bacillus tuaregi TaxID=1816695 RepID=UPI0008F97723|nr:flavocytochrome c [Bacillus tuaregi]